MIVQLHHAIGSRHFNRNRNGPGIGVGMMTNAMPPKSKIYQNTFGTNKKDLHKYLCAFVVCISLVVIVYFFFSFLRDTKNITDSGLGGMGWGLGGGLGGFCILGFTWLFFNCLEGQKQSSKASEPGNGCGKTWSLRPKAEKRCSETSKD